MNWSKIELLNCSLFNEAKPAKNFPLGVDFSFIAATSFSFNLNLNSINQKEIQNVLDWIQIRLI